MGFFPLRKCTDPALPVLHRAAIDGDTKAARSLLRSGEDPNIRGPGDITPLIQAAYNGFIDMARLLLESGASLSAKASDGRAALHFAALNGKIKMVRFLLQMNADVSVKDNAGHTALDVARGQGKNDVVRLLESTVQTNSVASSQAAQPPAEPAPQISLHEAAREGKTEEAILLIDNGASVNTKNEDDATPLHLAANAETAKCLLLRGADLTAKGSFMGFAPFHAAAANGHTDVARLFLESGADIDVRDNFEHTPLSIAASEGRTDTAKFLLENGAELNTENMFGDTPLAIAKLCGHSEVAQFLESAVQTCSGTKPPANTDTPLLAAVKKGDADSVWRLLENGANPNEKDEKGRTLLHHSVARRHTSATALLINKGADPNAKDAMLLTPLHYACLPGSIDSLDVVRMLLEGGADASVMHDVCGTPLDMAIKEEKTELVRMFEEAIKNPRSEATEEASSAFLAKFCEFTDDMHPAVVLEQLWPLISNTPELQLYYTAASVAYRQGRINEIERNKLIKKGLHVAVKTAVNRESIVVFKLALDHALTHGYITRAEQLGLDNDAEVNRMSEAPFVKDMKSCIKANASTIALMNERLNAHETAINDIHDKLDAHAQAIQRNASNIKATRDALVDFRRSIRLQKKVESTVKFLKFAVNAVSAGIGGELVEIGVGIMKGVTKVTEEVGSVFDHIIDLSDSDALIGLVNSMGASLDRVPFDPVAFLQTENVEGVVDDLFYDKVGGIAESMYEKNQMRQIKALEGLTVAAVACSVTTFDVVADARAPAFGAVPPPSPTPGAGSGAARKSLSEFLQENELEEAKDELTKHGYKTVRALKRTAEDQGSQKAFIAHMRTEGIGLSGGDFAELYMALMDI